VKSGIFTQPSTTIRILSLFSSIAALKSLEDKPDGGTKEEGLRWRTRRVYIAQELIVEILVFGKCCKKGSVQAPFVTRLPSLLG
jgi:hypothetical protein